jgi:FkbM family methyltransferase
VYRNRLVAYLTWRLVLKQPRIRLLATRMLVRDRNEWIRLFGTKVFVNRRDEIGYWRANRNQHRSIVARDEIPSLLRISAFVARSSTFVDCGANVGLFTAAMLPLRKVLPNLKFYAYEANPSTFFRLGQTLAGSGATTENIALSNREGVLSMASGAASGVFGVPGGDFQIEGEVVKVPCRRLDSYEIEGSRLFLKVDVEGHELEVLEGASAFFEDQRVFGVFIDGATREEECLNLLAKYGFAFFNVPDLEQFETGDFRILALKSSLLDDDRLEQYEIGNGSDKRSFAI